MRIQNEVTDSNWDKLVWRNFLVSYGLLLFHGLYTAIDSLQHPSKYVLQSYDPYLIAPIKPNHAHTPYVTYIFLFIVYVALWYFYRGNDVKTRFSAGVVALGLFMSHYVTPYLAADIANNHFHSSHLFLYIILSHFTYAFFGPSPVEE